MIISEIRELSFGEIEELKVDISMLDTCRLIRRCAKLGRIRVDDSKASPDDANLLKYVEYCEYTPEEYFVKILSQLQPYMLYRKNDKDDFFCLIDNIYIISLRTDDNKQVVVSLDVDNNYISELSLKSNCTNIYVTAFAKSIGSLDYTTGKVSVDILITRGMMTLPISIIGAKYKDVFIVKKSEIERVLKDYCDQYIMDLYTSNLSLDFGIEVFSVLQQLEYTVYGNDTFSSISLLIDALDIQKDYISKRVADFALVTFLRNLRITKEQKSEIMELLRERYRSKNINSIEYILHRIDRYLG